MSIKLSGNTLLFLSLIYFLQNCYLSKPVPEDENPPDESAFPAYSEALILNDNHKYNEALKKINTAIAMNDKIAKFPLLKAQILENSGRVLDALTAYKQVLKIQIYNPAVYEKMGKLLAGIGQYHSAIQNVKKAYAQKPQDTRLLIIVADYYIDLESYDRAKYYLNMYENETPKVEYSDEYFCVKGKVYFNDGQYSKTINVLDKCRLSKPLAAEFNKLYLDALLNSEQYDALYQYLITLNEDQMSKGDQHFYKGVYYFCTKNDRDALSQLEIALEFKTEDSRVYYYLGKVYLELGNLSKSKEMFEIFRKKTEKPELKDVQIEDLEKTGN